MFSQRSRLLSLGCYGPFVSALVLMVGLSGCGGGSGDQKATAAAGGKVSFNGAPVTGGSITLSPVGDGKQVGKPASATIQSDGTFKLSTYGNNDGAVIGKHRVTFSPPPGETKEGPDGHAAQLPSPFDGLTVQTLEVEIKSGSNELKIELAK